MCGRFCIIFSYDELLAYFNLVTGKVEPRYNVAPSQEIPAVRVEQGARTLAALRWGLVPSWSKEPAPGFSTINARSETAHTSPAFRSPFRHRRCLIPASGFFEWKREGKQKKPWYIHRKDGRPLAFAGLWEHWSNLDGSQTLETCAILTTAANEAVAALHDRMPVILEPGDFDLWLDPAEWNHDRLAPILCPAGNDLLAMYPVSRYVNKPANEGPECIAPLDPLLLEQENSEPR